MAANAAARWPRQDLRLIGGVAALVAAFLGYGLYTLHATSQLRRYQRDVLARNRADTEQLLRIQQDAYQLANLVRDMVRAAPAPNPAPAIAAGSARWLAAPPPQPAFAVWGLEFRRLRLDLNQAMAAEAAAGPPGRADAQRRELNAEFSQFWSVCDQAFHLARLGYERPAENLVRRELLPQRSSIDALVSGWLRENQRRQAATQAAMNGIYGRISRNFLLLMLALLAGGAALAAWAIAADRLAFARMRSLADQLDERSRQLAGVNARLLDAQESILQQVSRDLHDEFGQILAAVGVALARAETRGAAAAGDPVAAEELRRARSAVREAQGKIRALSQLLRPAILDDFGLEKALARQVEQLGVRAGIETRFERVGELGVLPGDQAIQLYRIAQEALTNAARHAQARRITVRLCGEEGKATLEVADDGRGFAPAPDHAGLGVLGMRQRAESLGGEFSIGAGVGGGTCVRARVPINTPRPARTANADETGATPRVASTAAGELH